MKSCTKCLKPKELTDFHLRHGSCKICYNLSRKTYREANKERYNSHRIEWAKNNPDRVKELRSSWYRNNPDYNKNYYQLNRSELIEGSKQYRYAKIKSDVNYRLAVNMRKRISNVLKGQTKTGSAVHDLGCSFDQLKLHLESLFKPGMTWENWSINGWHIDHKIALCYFDLSDKEQFLEACNYKNLQPIWAKDHYKKSAKERGGAKSH
jgi:hypothetical protein